MTAPKGARLPAEFEPDAAASRAATADLVAAIARVQLPASAGAHGRRTLAQMAADIGMHATELEAGGAAVVRIGGQVWR